MEKFLADAFQKLNSLTEDTFEFNVDGIEKMKEFEEEPVVDEVEVVDLDAETEEEVQDSYIGKVILDCDVCHSKLFKDVDEVEVDEDTQLANVGEECPFCSSNMGYKVVGQVAEYCDHCHDEDHEDDEEHEEKKEIKVDGDEVEEKKTTIDKEKFQECLKKARARKVGVKRVTESRSRKLREEVDDVVYDIVDYMIKDFAGKKVISWDEFNDSLYDACVELGCKDKLDKEIDNGDFEGDVRAVLSYNGYTTDFEGENEGGLTLVERKTSMKDRLDAYRDDRVEKARKALDKTIDDADAQRDDRRKKDGIKEGKDDYIEKAKEFAKKIATMDERTAKRWYYREYAFDKKGPQDKGEKIVYDALRKVLKIEEKVCNEADEPAAISLEKAQKWVDYDMKRYGKISKRTNDLVKKAGFQILKDDHGDYEVGAGKFEACEKKDLKEAPLYGLEPQNDNRKSFYGKAKVFVDDNGVETLYSYDTPVAKIEGGKLTLLPRWDESQTTLRHVREFLRQHGLKADSLAQMRKDYLKEDFERVDIETDREKMSMTADKDGKVTVTTEPKKEDVGGEVIEPVDVEVKDEIEANTEGEDEIDIDVDEFGEEEFDELGEAYLKKVYENVKSYKTSTVRHTTNGLQLEGVITFNSGATKKTSFVFEALEATKDNKVRMIGENKQITRGKKAFSLVGDIKDKKFISESLNYNYRTKNSDGKSQRVYGTIKK